MIGSLLAALVLVAALSPVAVPAGPDLARVAPPPTPHREALRPHVPVPSRVAAQTLSSAETQAVESARDGRYADAIAQTTRLLDAEPSRLAARIIRALAYYYSAQPPLALDDLNYALERVPAEGTARTLRALVHLELGNYAEAMADGLEAARHPDPVAENLGAALLVLGRVLLARGQHLEAGSYFRKVADQPDLANARVAQIALELLAAIPAAPDQRLPTARDAGGGLQAIDVGPRRSVRFQADDGVTPAGAAAVTRLLDARLAAIAAVTGVVYSGPVQLIIYKSEWELERAIGGQYRGPGLSRALRQGIRTADGPWRQHIHIAITNPSLLFDVTHEAAHLVQAELGLDDAFATIPAWLMEGQAEHVSMVTLAATAPYSVRLRLTQRNSGVAAAARADRLQDFRRLERFRDWSVAQALNAELAYGQAYYAVALLHERHGLAAPLAILRAVSAGRSFEEAFRTVTGGAVDAFYAEALDYARRQALSAEP